MSKDQFIADHERMTEQFAMGEIDGTQFLSELRDLGTFTPRETRDEYFDCVKDMNEDGLKVLAMIDWLGLDYTDALLNALEELPEKTRDEFADKYTDTFVLPEGLSR